MALGRRPRAVFPYTDRPKPVNNAVILLLLTLILAGATVSHFQTARFYKH